VNHSEKLKEYFNSFESQMFIKNGEGLNIKYIIDHYLDGRTSAIFLSVDGLKDLIRTVDDIWENFQPTIKYEELEKGNFGKICGIDIFTDAYFSFDEKFLDCPAQLVV
jgi:hypothetical protein